MKLKDIVIPKDFQLKSPRIGKLIECARYFQKFGALDKPITVNKQGILMDGYVRYIVAKKMGLEEVPTIINEAGVYVLAHHAVKGKRYWWKVKSKDERKFIDKVYKGDRILVNTKKGLCTVTVTNVKVCKTPKIRKTIKMVEKF